MSGEESSGEVSRTPRRIAAEIYTDPVIWALITASATLGYVLNSWLIAWATIAAFSAIYLELNHV